MVDISKKDMFSAIRGLNIKDYSTDELEHLLDLFNFKSKQIEEVIRRRKREGKN